MSKSIRTQLAREAMDKTLVKGEFHWRYFNTHIIASSRLVNIAFFMLTSHAVTASVYPKKKGDKPEQNRF